MKTNMKNIIVYSQKFKKMLIIKIESEKIGQ